MSAQLSTFDGPSLIVGVPFRTERPLGIQKSIIGPPDLFLRASLTEVKGLRDRRISALFLDVEKSLSSAEKVFHRFYDLGFDVFLSRYHLLRAEQSRDDKIVSELQSLYRCGWSFLPFLLPQELETGWKSGLDLLVSRLNHLRDLAAWEQRVIHRCWNFGIWHWSGLVGVPGIRSALRIIETENVHMIQMGLTRARQKFRYGQEIFDVAIQRVLERRPEQLRTIERMLGGKPYVS